MATLVFITSSSLYIYIRHQTNTQLNQELQKQADYLLSKYPFLEEELKKQKEILKRTLNIDAKIVNAPFMHFRPQFFLIIKRKKHYYLQGYFAYNFNSQSYLLLTKDITNNIAFEHLVYKAVIFSNIISLIVIIFYAFILSKMLTKPINYFSQKIAKMNEEKLAKIELKTIPAEFKPLGKSINQLIQKIESFIYYKKELFIGAAHELKTPLAVMKTKAQVTLLKKEKNIESLTQSIEQNVKSINSLNSIVESILAFGRAEGSQFEKAQKIDIISYIQELVEEFNVIAQKEGKRVHYRYYNKKILTTIQPMLLRHILQNTLQNAIAFTPKGSRVTISCFECKETIVIRIKDSGPGFPKDLDFLAPFQRSKSSKGTGLGLFLAKNSADALNAKLLFQNKKLGTGAIVTLLL